MNYVTALSGRSTTQAYGVSNITQGENAYWKLYMLASLSHGKVFGFG
jgi:uncharacterized membrane protein